jgi:hypothetical protein
VKQYIIDLNPDNDKLEPFEINDENLAEIEVQLPGLKTISGDNYKVMINLSPDAMIGLGTELIRKGTKIKRVL